MSALRDLLSRPLREQRPWLLAALAAGVLTAAALLVLPSLSREHARSQAQLPTAPSPVINPPTAALPASASRAELALARATARAFLPGYLRFLYGRGRAEQIAGATASLRAGLRANRVRVTPAQRRRHPHVVSIALIAQSNDTAIATARIDDGGVAPYALTFTLERHAGRWAVSDLAND